MIASPSAPSRQPSTHAPQGRVVPAEFIGVVKSQQSVYLKGELVSNHDELMCNFFAQADALAMGKESVALRAEGLPQSIIPHKTFSGGWWHAPGG